MHKYFSECEIKEMNDKKVLKVRGKESFAEGESVELTVEMKNVKKLSVKVFEVNTENFLRTKNSDDYGQIEVDFLIPSEEYTY